MMRFLGHHIPKNAAFWEITGYFFSSIKSYDENKMYSKFAEFKPAISTLSAQDMLFGFWGTSYILISV